VQTNVAQLALKPGRYHGLSGMGKICLCVSVLGSEGGSGRWQVKGGRRDEKGAFTCGPMMDAMERAATAVAPPTACSDAPYSVDDR
jgi:hypothetical protein